MFVEQGLAVLAYGIEPFFDGVHEVGVVWAYRLLAVPADIYCRFCTVFAGLFTCVSVLLRDFSFVYELCYRLFRYQEGGVLYRFFHVPAQSHMVFHSSFLNSITRYHSFCFLHWLNAVSASRSHICMLYSFI